MYNVNLCQFCTWTDHWARLWSMCITSMGSRRDCTEAFLLTTSAVSPPKLWPSPLMSSWNRSYTWTSRLFYTFKVCNWACSLWVIKQLNLDTSLDFFNVLNSSAGELPFHWRRQGNQLTLTKGNWMSGSKLLHICPISFPLTSCLMWLETS